jgi:hypothetical protein
MGAVEVRLPRVSDVPAEVSADGFHSEVVSRYQRRSRTQARLLARLYLEGLSSGDFEPVFRALVGETAALSPSSILKLKAEWQQEYETWKQRPLRGRYVYLYADGLYLKALLHEDTDWASVAAGAAKRYRTLAASASAPQIDPDQHAGRSPSASTPGWLICSRRLSLTPLVLANSKDTFVFQI